MSDNEAGVQTFVILLRGVMPTGKNKVLMAPLRAALGEAGLAEVRTYIQSGNVLARSALRRTELEALVHDTIRQKLGADLTVIARTAAELRQLLGRTPFPQADTAKLYYCLLAAAPAAGRVAEFRATDWSPDEVRLVGDTVYARYATKHSDSRYTNNHFERRLGVAATTRNHNTIARLVELSSP